MPAGFATMSDAQQPISDYYRETAEQLRQLARVSRLKDIRADLLELSARFERIAAYVDAAIRLGAPGFPCGELLPVDYLISRVANGPIGTTAPPRELDCIRKRGVLSPGPSRGAHGSSSNRYRSDVRPKSKGVRR